MKKITILAFLSFSTLAISEKTVSQKDSDTIVELSKTASIDEMEIITEIISSEIENQLLREFMMNSSVSPREK